MTLTDWIGFIGVTILLFAFFLNLRNIVTKDSFLYLTLNLVGASIACFASVLLNYWPFIILEGAWTIISLFGLLQYLKTTGHARRN